MNLTPPSGRRCVAYVVNPYPAPSHTFVRREIAGLESAGWSVHRFTHRWHDGELIEPADIAERARTTRLTPRPTWTTGTHGRRVGRGTAKGIAAAALAADLRLHMARLNIRHVHAHFDTATDTALLATADSTRTFSFTVHGPEEFEQPEALRVRVGAAAFVACISEYTRQRVAGLCPDHAAKLYVIRCGIDVDQYEPTPTPDTDEIVCVGRLVSRKGQGDLIHNLAVVPGWRLRLVGDGPDRGRLEALAKKLGVTDRVRFVGWANESAVRRHIAECRALVLLSNAEGLPVVLMEALALGRVALAYNVGAIGALLRPPMLLDPGFDIIATANDDEEEHALRWVLDTSPRELDERAVDARRHVLERHDAARNAAALAKLLESAVESAVAPAARSV
ncbi:MAG: glycosyltransferase [Planctomycetota bacterium]